MLMTRYDGYESRGLTDDGPIELTSDWLLYRKAGTEPSVLQAIKKRKLSRYGHVLRKRGVAWKKSQS